MRRAYVLIGAVCSALVLIACLTLGPKEKNSTTAQQTAEKPVPAQEGPTDAGTPADDAAAAEEEADAAPPVALVTECHAKVLVYHHIQDHYPGEDPVHFSLNVPPRLLDKQLDYLKANDYAVIPLGDLVNCMENGVAIPEKAVVLTFDDRWKTQYKNAFPLLKQHGMTATFYITTAVEGPAMITWKELAEMKQDGMTIASHTRLHPMLTNPVKPLAFELKDSRKTIKEKLGDEPDFLAYPYGAYNERVIKAVKDAGYRSARTCVPGSVHKKDDLLAMKAYGAPEHLQAFIKLLEK